MLRRHREPLSLALRGGQGWLFWDPEALISDKQLTKGQKGIQTCQGVELQQICMLFYQEIKVIEHFVEIFICTISFDLTVCQAWG